MKINFPRSIMGLLGWLFSLGFTLAIIGTVAGVLLFMHYSHDLPDYSQLAEYDPPTITRLYAADGKLLAEYATEKREFVPLSAIPKRVISAFLSAEDKNFYQNDGIDFGGLARAVRDNIINYGMGKSLVGGSTITQQVVKNFLLTNEKSIERKVKEAILAMRISRVYSKDKILELYLNEIYLGQGAYGVAAAAQAYFNKSMDELTVEEAALLAAQPKGPSLYNPKRSYEMALQRRNWVLDRMHDAGYLTTEEAETAKKIPITLKTRDAAEVARADFFSEEVRRELSDLYGNDALYEGGLVVKTTLDPQLQQYADHALRMALVEYDRRRGYRGPVAHIDAKVAPKATEWKTQLTKLSKEHEYQLIDGQKLAIVTDLDAKKATVTFDDETQGEIPFALMKWTRLVIADGKIGPEVKKPADIVKVGDVVMVAPISTDQKKQVAAAEQKKSWDLQQVPEVNGAIVVLDPHTGRVLAMSGGYAYGGTEFNRATQARRQPGSAFKPFAYMAGLENGLTPSTILLDAPVEMEQGPNQPMWRPENYHDDYLGPTTLRVGLEKSRNTMTVRLAQIIGLDKVVEIGKRFGIYENPPPVFSLVLGAGETTLLKLATAYGIIDNGGKRITPSLIERIDDRHGKIIYRRDSRACDGCQLAAPEDAAKANLPPMLPDTREQIVDPRVAYEMTSMLEGVTIRGTGARAHLELKNIVAGKTGTTNDSLDTWFVGFTPDLVAGVFVGYDRPRTLGKKETGASVALPAFIDFMKNALKDVPNQPFRIPPGISLVKVDLHTGVPVSDQPPEGVVIDEAFITGKPVFIPGVTPPDNGSAPTDAETPENGDMPKPIRVNPPPVELPLDERPLPQLNGTGGLY